jgi:glycosyltransferase involved in cell wall biosynthesis
LKSAWIALIERKNLEDAAAVHVTSTVEREDIRAFGWPLHEIESIPNGLVVGAPADDGAVSEDVLAATVGRPYALFFGRLSWKKGLERLLRAFRFAASGRLVIAGTDDEGLSDALRSLAAELGVADRVQILPRTILGADKAHLYAQARAFVLLSDSENFGNTVLEAMDHGLPVVVTPGVGAAEVVAEGGGGLVVPAGDLRAAGEAISDLLADAPRASALGAAGRAHVRAHFGWDRIAERMEGLYGRLIGAGAEHAAC